MKTPLLFLSLFSSLLLSAAPEWQPSFNDKPVNAGQTAQVDDALPTAPIVVPQAPRKVLVYSATAGFRHWTIPVGKSDPEQAMPQWLELDFGEKKAVNSVYLTFDTDLAEKRYVTWEFLDEHRMPPTAVSDYRVQYFDGGDWVTVAEREGNYMRRCIDRFDTVETSKIRVMVDKTNGDPSARIYEIRAYNE